MRRRVPCLLWFLFLSVLPLSAPISAATSVQASCEAPFAAFWKVSPERLRHIAASCADRDIAMLFYNRAYHAKAMGALRRLSHLETRGSDEDTVRYEQGWVFIGLAEELARHLWSKGGDGSIRELNAAYDNSIQILEYTLKGYTMLIGGSDR